MPDVRDETDGLLEAWRLTSLRLPGAHAALVEADSLARARIFEVCCG